MLLKVCRPSIVLSVLLALGCSSSSLTGPTVQLNEVFELKPNEAATVDTTPIKVHFVSVANDSRCPIQVICVQEGDATVKIEVLESGAATKSYELHTATNSQPVTHQVYTIELVKLAPYPTSAGQVIVAADYRATFRVTR